MSFIPATPACQFVHSYKDDPHFHSDDDEDMIARCEDEHLVFRSTPSPNLVSPAMLSFGQFTPQATPIGHGTPSPLVHAHGFKRQEQPQQQGQEVDPTTGVKKVDFVSLAQHFPLSDKALTGMHRDSVDSRTTASTVPGSWDDDQQLEGHEESARLLMTSSPTIKREPTSNQGVALLSTTATITREGFASCTQPVSSMTPQQTNQVYTANLTTQQCLEIEALAFNTGSQVHERRKQLQAQRMNLGYLEERPEGTFFIPGKRRSHILDERRYHQRACREAQERGGDVSWAQERAQQFENVYREFCIREASYKQDLMLLRQELASPFSSCPTLGDRFVLLKLIGRGGNGEVWQVMDYVDNKRICALKISTSGPHTQREFQKHKALDHSNITKIGEQTFTLSHAKKLYEAFTLEHMESDLQRLMELFGSLEEGASLKFLFQIVHALAYMHDKGIAHYDLKPSNILVGRNDCVKLTDFDLARPIHEPATSCLEGTLRFLPPECYLDSVYPAEECTAMRADMWMLGVVFYIMLFGSHPFHKDKTTERGIRENYARYYGNLQPPKAISDYSLQILRGCLHPDPRCRPTALQLYEMMRPE